MSDTPLTALSDRTSLPDQTAETDRQLLTNFKTLHGERPTFTEFLLMWLIETVNGASYDEVAEGIDEIWRYYAHNWIVLRESIPFTEGSATES